MIALYTVQFAIPLILIIWVRVALLRNLVGFLAQAFASASVLFAVSLVGIWTVPPWWTLYALGLLLLVATAVGLERNRPFASVMPARTHARVVALAMPLDRGNYLVVNGGSRLSTNAHLKTLDPGIQRMRIWRGQSYAVDIVAIDRLGVRARGLRPAELSVYRIYGSKVVAP